MTTHTDRELLDLAAKAAGYEVRWHEVWQCFVHINPNNMTQPPSMAGQRMVWVPFNDDGDALRLALKLGMLVDCDEVLQEVEVVLVMRGHDDDYVRMSEKYGNDPYAATRRAIVRAAAEIGGIAP